MMYTRAGENPVVQALPGITRQLVANGERMTVIRFELAAGSEMPMHTHPHEQIGFVLSGKLEMTVDGETRICSTGDSYSIPSGVPHTATKIIEDSVVVDIFSPVREDYLS